MFRGGVYYVLIINSKALILIIIRLIKIKRSQIPYPKF